MKRKLLIWVTTLLLILTGTACSLLPTRAPLATSPGSSGKIAVLTNGWKSRDLHVIDLAADNLAPHSLGESTFRLGWVSNSSCSPDGSKLALETDYYYSGHGEIHVLDADGTIHTLIPSGELLAAATGKTNPIGREASETADEYQTHPGTLIDGHIFFVNSSAARWSPDGTQIAFQSMYFADTVPPGISSVAFDIFIMAQDGSNIRNLTNQQGDNRFVAWSADGDQILFQSRPLASSQEDGRAYWMNSDGSNRHSGTLQDTYADGACPTASADGEWRVFVSPDGDAQVTNIDESIQYQLTDTSTGESGPVSEAVWLR